MIIYHYFKQVITSISTWKKQKFNTEYNQRKDSQQLVCYQCHILFQCIYIFILGTIGSLFFIWFQYDYNKSQVTYFLLDVVLLKYICWLIFGDVYTCNIETVCSQLFRYYVVLFILINWSVEYLCVGSEAGKRWCTHF